MESDLTTGVIAAVAALSGVVISQVFSLLHAHFDRRHHKRVLLRTKYEVLVEHLNESLVWVSVLSSVKTWDELHLNSQPIAARRIYGLVLLYFPLLKPHAEQYLQASVALQGAISTAFSPTDGATAGAHAVHRTPQAFRFASDNFHAAREALDAQIEKCAATYIVA